MHEIDDAELVRRAQRGDVAAVGTLYDRHHERIFRYVWSRTHDRHLAEDLTGEVFSRMVDHLPRYRRRAEVPFTAWLYRIAHNLVVDHYRREERATWVPLVWAEGVQVERSSAATAVERQLAVEEVMAALEQIDPVQCEVVRLRFLIGLSLGEVAAVVGKSAGAVKSLQHRGLKALRLALQPDES